MIVCLQEVTLWDEVTALPIPPDQSSHRAGNGDAIGKEMLMKNEKELIVECQAFQ